MPIIGVKRTRSLAAENESHSKKPLVSGGFWSNMFSYISEVVGVRKRDDHVQKDAGFHGDNPEKSQRTMAGVHSVRLKDTPSVCKLRTPILSELERHRSYDVITVSAPPSLRPASSPLFSPVLRSSHHRQRVVGVARRKVGTGEQDLIQSNQLYTPAAPSLHHVRNLGTIQRPHWYDKRSCDTLITPPPLNKPMNTVAMDAVTMENSLYTVCKEQTTDRSLNTIRGDHRGGHRGDHGGDHRGGHRNHYLYNNVLNSLTGLTGGNHSNHNTPNVAQASSLFSHQLGSHSPIDDWQRWIKDFKGDHHSNRKDVSAQIEVAEKYVQLQAKQRQVLCDDRMEQFRNRLATRLDLSEYMESDSARSTPAELQLQHTEEQQAKITWALAPGRADEEVSCGARIRLKKRDIRTLGDTVWLNDEVINFYMTLIVEGCHSDGVHVYSSFFYTKLLSAAGYTGVRRWTKKVDIFSKQLLLIPVHLGMHWCLAAIDFSNQTISYYDSLKGHNSTCLESLRQYLVQESLDKKKAEYDMTNWRCVTHQDIPEQLNSSDCGVFMCMYARHLARRVPFKFSQEDMPNIRSHMILELIEKKLL